MSGSRSLLGSAFVGHAGDVDLTLASADSLGIDERSEIIALCEVAFGEDFSRHFELLPGSVHVRARDRGGRLVSHAEWVTRWLQPAGLPLLRTAYLEAVATAPDHQGQGLATTVLERLIEAVVSEEKWELAALSPACPDFYARRGWEPWTGPLGIRHGEVVESSPRDEQVMVLRLPMTPPQLDTSAPLTAEWREGELW